MTIKELSQLYYLNREIEQDKSRLEELCSKAEGVTQTITGMPHASGTSDKVGKFSAEIADLQSLIEVSIQRITEERAALWFYINGIPDSLTREIFKLRFDKGLRWDQVAECIGGGNTSGSVKQRVFREIRKSSPNVTR